MARVDPLVSRFDVLAAAPYGLAAVPGPGYDAAKDDTKRRRSIAPSARREEQELTQSDRGKVIANARDLRRNFAAAAWAVRKHLDYVSAFTFQPASGDQGFDRELEAYVETWSEPANFDACGRHGLDRFMRLAEESRTLDGDLLLVKVADKVQAIEGDRVRNPLTLPEPFKANEIFNGVRLDALGRSTHYFVHQRVAGAGYAFERAIPAENAWLHGYFDRFDQCRGISPLAAAINVYRDAYEGIDYALAKAKVSQLFALVFFRTAAESAGLLEEEADEDAEPGETTSTTPTKYTADFGKGPAVLDLEPGDDAKFLESATPSGEFQAFMQVVLAIALKALDIPYSFWDESFTNYSGSRQALLQYEQSAANKRRDNRQLRDDLTRWRITTAIVNGDLRPPRGLTLARNWWDWLPTGLPWIDPQREVNANAAAIAAGITSRTRVCRAAGANWLDIADELQAEKTVLSAKGLLPAPTPAAAEDAP